MSRNLRCWLAALALVGLVADGTRSGAQDFLTCGWDEVRQMRLDGTNLVTLWSWNATNSDLPAAFRARFTTTSEARPLPGGAVLVTSSGGDSLDGGVALIRPGTSHVSFYARGPNAHSAELLPGHRIAAAFSYHPDGNRVALFDLAQPDVELFSTPLWAAHGLVWDEARQRLWALADSFLQAYALTNWNTTPQLVATDWIGLPSGGGHDLAAVPDSPEMIVTTDTHVWLFHRDTRAFRKHPLLGDTPAVKSVSVAPDSGRTLFVQADGPWWSEWLRFLNPPLAARFPGDHFYKARWLAVSRPALAIRRTPSAGLTISWPARWAEYQIEAAPGLTATNWSVPPEPVWNDGTNCILFLEPPFSQERWFRLRSTQP